MMDIVLQRCDGMPEGCLLSVRAGSTRRQAPIEVGRALRVPADADSCSEVQVDILAVLSRRKIELSPSQIRYGPFPLDSQLCGNEASYEVEIRRGGDSIVLGKPPFAKPPFASKRSNASGPGGAPRSYSHGPSVRRKEGLNEPSAHRDAQKYMDDHGLLQVVQAAMKTTVHTRPDNPFVYMAQLLLAASSKTDGLSLQAVERAMQTGCGSARQREASPEAVEVENPAEELPRYQGHRCQPAQQLYSEVHTGSNTPALQSFRGIPMLPSQLASEVQTGCNTPALQLADVTQPLGRENLTAVVKVQGLDFNSLISNSTLLGSFKTAVKEAIASDAGHGIRPEHIDIALSAGSVIVHAVITPPVGIAVAAIQSQLKVSSHSLRNTVVAKVACLDGISDVARGTITVTEVNISQSIGPSANSAANAADTIPSRRPLHSARSCSSNAATDINGVDEGSVAADANPAASEIRQVATSSLHQVLLSEGIPAPSHLCDVAAPPRASSLHTFPEPPAPPSVAPPPLVPRLSPAPSTVDQFLEDDDETSTTMPYSRSTCQAVASQSLQEMLESRAQHSKEQARQSSKDAPAVGQPVYGMVLQNGPVGSPELPPPVRFARADSCTSALTLDQVLDDDEGQISRPAVRAFAEESMRNILAFSNNAAGHTRPADEIALAARKELDRLALNVK